MTFKENKPIYLQIADRIMDEILQDVYEEGGRTCRTVACFRYDLMLFR